jgi:CRISPR system Cascade subunit CasA
MGDLTEPAFDLVDEPWLPCLMADGSSRELGLRNVLLNAHLVRELSLDIPTQFPAVLRLLLAIVHRALRQPGTSGGPRKRKDWEYLWELAALPRGPISGYLDEYRDRFGLFHSAAPFMQVAGLEAASGDAKTVAQLIPFAAKGNNAPLFSAARDDDPPSLTCGEAARWLLHVHAWDTAAIKTGAVGDSHVKGGKTTGNPTGPLGQLGVLIPTGRTLWHTLLFNLLVLGDDISPADDGPTWEAGPLTAQWQERYPRGVLDLYTWPGRRVRLVPEQTPSGVRARRAVVAAGDRIADITALTRLEPHTAWRRSEVQEKKLKRPRVYLPVRHQPGRELWRGLGPILAQARADRPGGEDQYRGPLALEQLADRADLLRGEAVRLFGAGITYGNQAAVIDETYADMMPLPVAVLADCDGAWEAAALDAVRAAEDAAAALAGLAANLARAAGCDDDRLLANRRRAARARLYAELDGRFRTWIAGLGESSGEPGEVLSRWRDQVREQAGWIAGELLAGVPPEAVRGRDVQFSRERSELVNAARAEIWFTAAIRKAQLVTGGTADPQTVSNLRADEEVPA